MTPVTACAGRHLALFGLGGSGLATTRALLAGGATVTAWDDNAPARDKAAAAGVTVADLREADWSTFASLVLSPGVPLTHPVPHWTVGLARGAGIEVIGDIELFCRERAKIAPRAPFVAITGTNGKSTTTALTAHLFRTAGWDVQMGGNIGVAALDLAPPANNRVHVLELSTFQIDLTPGLNPSLGILINLTPDHIDRHGTMENYAAIKERLITAGDAAIVGIDDPSCAAIATRRRAKGPLRTVSVVTQDADITRDGTRLRADGRIVADLDGMTTLRGRHNAQNAAMAIAALQALSPTFEPAQLDAALRSFPGLPHRMEQVGQRGRVLFVNDSKATNADAAEQSLKSFRDIHWIVGGLPKDGGIEPLAPFFENVAKAYLIGASSEAFATTLDGRLPYARCDALDRAVAEAAAEAARAPAPEPVVLLAPACASYDQFKNFEARGDAFRALVARLPASD